ncbi:MAG: heme NO-binding domain-containing protein [Bacteroidetes bacterium]|nr:heme NO-binding domain-containing protein [Fibrella sp.]
MKGMVFTEFLDMVEQQYDYKLVDTMLTQSVLPSGGAYTSVGTYNHREMVELVNQFSSQTQVPVADAFRVYGRYLFIRFTQLYAHLLNNAHSAFGLLTAIEHHIHVEVKKLYPDAELPRFESEQPSDDHLIMTYQSERQMADFAQGLIEGCLAHFGETATITRTNLNEEASLVRFEIIKDKSA